MMEAFPFSPSEWQKIMDVSHPLTNAALADDDVLGASLYVELLAVLVTVHTPGSSEGVE
jgi:hypothetical protein